MKSHTPFYHRFSRLTGALLAGIFAFNATGCELLEGGSEDPNELGGDPNIELTEVGQRTTASFNIPGNNPAFNNLDAEATVSENRNGIVTYDVEIGFDLEVVRAVDSMAGTSTLPDAGKRAILDLMLDRYGATLDTTDPNNMKILAQVKLKVTDAGIQDFITSEGNESQPFTIVKYDAEVGDEYTFNKDGNMIERRVVSRSTEDDYQVAFWLLKVIKVRETEENHPLIEEIVYVTNHKYGLVGIELKLKNGEEASAVLFPPTL